ncbi:RagB/SusD family nutrient uptake outer membrane protein [Sediminibacterium roseum]|uniref:RagB/SusD family nutrient uptake outer membrane protein n=1 Tax=Sediminibacterium roseum TaxID=1978412 RepID=A0ABW9ZTF6_9BACT|nr:RagB/SusD family nutrient uptake outer membrane protein [Sediminibacterium roseum]NCI50418.1 RagB/SusD family nutrient uptake outer membrane protein [Sediminibacterium roseum]
MKNIKMKFTLLVSTVTLMTACKKDFITITPQGQFLSENYYSNRDQAYTGLVGVYDVLRKNAGGFENMITFFNAASDDNYSGGGNSSDGAGIQSFANFTINPNLVPGSYWNDHYQGIFRANVLLSKIGAVNMNAAEKARFTAEAKALRAIYYFNLVRMFKNIPLLLEPVSANDIYNVTQAAPTAVYTQIEKDLSEAIPDLPNTVVLATEAGRLTKAAGQAMLGKVYLYDGKAAQAATQLALVNGPTPGQPNQYGNKLLANFADLWVFTNKFNSESILECVHTNQSNADWGFWGSSADEGNSVNQMVGPRSFAPTATYNGPDIYRAGWSFNTWTQDFYDAIKADPRFPSTVFDAKAYVAAGMATYIDGYMNTGYFIKKFLPLRSDQRTGGGTLELNFQQNDYIIRLADTYLLEAEALGATGTRAQALLDAVRARVGLTPVPVSLAAIKAERRLELAGEGHRFFDLVRWGDAAAKLGGRGFVAGKNEILPIPARELIGTKLTQNPNYQK